MLSFGPVDPDSPIPLYYQVESDLRRLIEEEPLAPGDTVPPENALSHAYGVSRHTIRMALARMERQGLLSRSAGRGTVVRPVASRTRFYLDRSFTRQMAELGRTARSVVMEHSEGTLGAHEADVLRLPPGASCLRMARLRLGDEEPVGFQQHVIATGKCPGLAAHSFEDASLYSILAEEYRLVIGTIRHTIGAAVADAQMARHLDLELGAPLLVVDTASFLQSGEGIEYTVSYYRSDRFEYRITHTENAASTR